MAIVPFMIFTAILWCVESSETSSQSPMVRQKNSGHSSHIGLSDTTVSDILSNPPSAIHFSPFLPQHPAYLATLPDIPTKYQSVSPVSRTGILITSAALAGL